MKFEKLSDAETVVMNVLWSSDKPLRASEVYSLVSENRAWSISTVKTLLDRLVNKKMAGMNYVKRFRYFFPAVNREEFFVESIGGLSRSIEGFSPVRQIASFLDSTDMTDADFDEIEMLLAKARERAREKG